MSSPPQPPSAKPRGEPTKSKTKRAKAPSANERLKILAAGAAWLVGLRGALIVLGMVLGSLPLPEVVLGALIVDLGTGRAGLLWSSTELARADVLRVLGAGAGVGAGVAALALGVALAAGWGAAAPADMHMSALVALVPAAAVAIRDELLYRGVPLLFAARAGIPTWAAVLFGALASPSAFIAATKPSPEAIVLAIANGALFGALYVRTRGAWAAVGAHAAWAMVVDVAARGGLFEIRWANGELASGDMAVGGPAWVAAAIALAAAAFVTLWRPRAFKPAAG